MAGHDIIVVGTSAGGVEVLSRLVHGLPPGLPAAVLVVCHVPSVGVSLLPEILSRSGPLLARHPRDGEPVYPGHVYVAPPDHHLVLEPGCVRVSRGPRENNLRPAIDPLFRSAARAYGRRVVGVVLTGYLSDGVAGLLAVRAAGGVAAIQDPADAIVPMLPRNALAIAGADHVVPADALAALLVDLIQQPVTPEGGETVPDPLERIPAVMAADMEAQARGARAGAVSVFTCPECGGSLWQLDDKGLVRFSCHVGHAYNGEVLLAEMSEAMEAALWSAVRTFREKQVLALQLAAQERQRGNAAAAARYQDQAREAQRHAHVLQHDLLGAAARPASEAG
jgi:two-component system chemotaxis response regulator CheB